MSSYASEVTGKFPKRGEDVFLSREEDAFVKRILSRPEAFPQEFWAAVIQKVSLDGEPIPRSQVQGLTQFSAKAAEVTTQEATTSVSYTDLATAGPQISGLSDGTYVVFFGSSVFVPSTGGGARSSVQVNSTAATDTDSIALSLAAGDQGAIVSISRALVKTIAGGNNNTITMKYKSDSGGSVDFIRRWIVALKIAN